MHLLAATPGAIDDGSPVDLGQTPGDIVFLSAADTELAGLSEARSEMSGPPVLRLANLTHLRHPMAVDMHIEACASRSKLVIARVLGGMSYWRYGAEQYAAHLHGNVPLALLPGDDKPDPDLRELSTVSDADYDALWGYLVEGGQENASNFLRYAQAMLAESERPALARPLLRAGVYWPGTGVADLETVQATWHADAPVVPLIFYRALVQGAGLNPINRMVKAIHRRGLNPLPIFVASLKDPVSSATLSDLFAAAPPDVILNCTSFAVGSANGDPSSENPLATPCANGAMVFQVVLSSMSEEAWDEGLIGLNARDIAMNVALPEVDGRVLSRAISFKGEAFFDEATECPIATYHARGDRVDFVADLAQRWARLRHTPVSDRKVALILANYPNKDGRLANGVGLDTPAATVNVLNLLSEAGYSISNAPETSADLMAQITAGPTNWLTDRADREGGELLTLDTYITHYKALPWDVRQQLEERWG
ncbi:MAG: cobaltochelatase subunit CobN, partial [Pseudomonadota bacterium]